MACRTEYLWVEPEPACKRPVPPRGRGQRAGHPSTQRGYSLYPWADSQGKGVEFISAFLRAAFCEGVNTNTNRGLRHVVESAGLARRHVDGVAVDPHVHPVEALSPARLAAGSSRSVVASSYMSMIGSGGLGPGDCTGSAQQPRNHVGCGTTCCRGSCCQDQGLGLLHGARSRPELLPLGVRHRTVSPVPPAEILDLDDQCYYHLQGQTTLVWEHRHPLGHSVSGVCCRLVLQHLSSAIASGARRGVDRADSHACTTHCVFADDFGSLPRREELKPAVAAGRLVAHSRFPSRSSFRIPGEQRPGDVRRSGVDPLHAQKVRVVSPAPVGLVGLGRCLRRNPSCSLAMSVSHCVVRGRLGCTDRLRFETPYRIF